MIISQVSQTPEKSKDLCTTCGKRKNIKTRTQRNRQPVVREPLKLATVGAIGGTNPQAQHTYPSSFAKQNTAIKQKQWVQRDITNDDTMRRFLAKEQGTNQREL